MQDEQHYPARVTALGPNTAVVMFTEYSNYEEVSDKNKLLKEIVLPNLSPGIAGRLAAEAISSCQK